MRHVFFICLSALLLAACAGQSRRQPQSASRMVAAGDSTIYGLACEGTGDTLLVFLRQPYTGADPDTCNILEAVRHNQLFGSVRAGDQVAILPNAADSSVADIVIVTEHLLGTWCHRVLPTLRRRPGQEGMSRQQLEATLTDSLRELLQIEREYGFTLKKDSVAFPVWVQKHTSSLDDDDNLIEYPPTKIYRQWYLRNGRLLLSQMRTDSVGNPMSVLVDTTQLVRLTADTLVLRYADGDRVFYRRDNSEE